MIIRWAEKSDLQSLVDIFNYEVLNGTASFSIRPRSLEERTVWFEQHDRGRFPLIVRRRTKGPLDMPVSLFTAIMMPMRPLWSSQCMWIMNTGAGRLAML